MVLVSAESGFSFWFQFLPKRRGWGISAYSEERGVQAFVRVRPRICLRFDLCVCQHLPAFTWPQLGPFFVPACPPLTAINGY